MVVVADDLIIGDVVMVFETNDGTLLLPLVLIVAKLRCRCRLKKVVVLVKADATPPDSSKWFDVVAVVVAVAARRNLFAGVANTLMVGGRRTFWTLIVKRHKHDPCNDLL